MVHLALCISLGMKILPEKLTIFSLRNDTHTEGQGPNVRRSATYCEYIRKMQQIDRWIEEWIDGWIGDIIRYQTLREDKLVFKKRKKAIRAPSCYNQHTESRLSGYKCTHIGQFSLILNQVPHPQPCTLRIHSHIYLPDFIDIHLKNL